MPMLSFHSYHGLSVYQPKEPVFDVANLLVITHQFNHKDKPVVTLVPFP
jgi:hypothetical protein